ncbi:MAG TPA: hypothetical protein VLB29_04110 [Nocardioidaceae bacterium]|nr:hypothetical protein [Nocardioidaceae bacterium]
MLTSGPGVVSTVFFAALLLGGIVILAYTLTRVIGGGIAPAPRRPRTAAASPARRALDERFARGDLTTDEYREQVRTLEEER